MKTNSYSTIYKTCVCLLFAAASLSHVNANSLGLTGFSGGVSTTAADRYGGNADLTIGWSFTVGSQGITLTDLGFFDQGGDGLNTAHNVGIWDSGGSLLASLTVPSGTTGSLVSGFRFAALSSALNLAANQTYIIGAEVTANSSDLFWNGTVATFDPAITYGQARDSAVGNNFTSGFTDPVRSRSDLNFGEFGPNFEFTPALVPDTGATLGLLLFSLTVLLGASRLRSPQSA
ncbi:MAG: VPDSG-CTERM sorting domain-containing protein [Chthoniobacterales bacterium]